MNFVELRKKIHDCMYEDSENSLQNIVTSLAWNDSVYRTFNEGLRLSQSEKLRKRLPNTLIEYIHHAHVAYVVITLRKLYENNSSDRKKEVNSLRTITRLIVDNAHLFTRENFVTFDGLPYDENDKLYWKINDTIKARHSQFDSLCQIAEGQKRKKNDRLNIDVAKMIHDQTKLKSEIERFANKFLAHSSAISNRPDEMLTFDGLTLRRIQDQNRNVIWSSQQIARFLGEAFLSEVATPLFDVLANWENGIFHESTKRKLTTYWYKRMHWWRKWTSHYREGDKIFLSPGS